MTAVPTLTDAKGNGGVIAQSGFDYQAWNALSRLPSWLKQPSFDGFVMEGLEDFEARFFSPAVETGRVLDRYQAKTATLTLGDIKELFASFKAFDGHHPGSVRSHTVVTPVLPSGLAWLARDPGRVKRARSFYRPFATIAAANDAKLMEDFVKTFGNDGAYYVDAMDVETSPMPDRPTAEAMFGAAVHTEYPELDLGARATARIFKALLDRVGIDRGRIITRVEVVALFKEAGVELPLSPSLPVRLRADGDSDTSGVIDLDGTAFSGNGSFPADDQWQSDLLVPLARLGAFARDQHHHVISLSGRYRLTTALCLGWSLRSASGFDLEVPTREGIWHTNAHPATAGTSLPWQVSEAPKLNQGRLAVAVGILREPMPGIQQTFPDWQALRLFLGQAIASEVEAQESVREMKRAIDKAIATLRPDGIDLFFVGPAAVAVALGHRWNGMPPTQLYEFVAESGTYSRTAILG